MFIATLPGSTLFRRNTLHQRYRPVGHRRFFRLRDIRMTAQTGCASRVSGVVSAVPKPSVLPREGCPMADKSPKKSSAKTVAAKSLKEKRADKKAKASSKSTSA